MSRRRVTTLMKVPAVLLAASFSVVAVAQSLLYTEKRGFLLLPAESISSSVTVSAEWSPDSQRVLIRRAILPKPKVAASMFLDPSRKEQESKIESEVAIYDRATKLHFGRIRLPASDRLLRAGWLGLTAVALVYRGDEREEAPARWSLTAVGSLAASNRTLATDTSMSEPELTLSPDARSAVVVFQKAVNGEGIYFAVQVRSDLRRAPAIPTGGYPPVIEFDRNGVPIIGVHLPRRADQGRSRIEFRRYEFGSDRYQVVDRSEATPKQENPREIVVQIRDASLPAKGGTSTIHPVTLEAKDSNSPAVLVVADGEQASLSPKGDAVLYLSQGCAFLREIVQVSKQELEAARNEAAKQEAMNQSKQAALAAIMYAADNDDRMPDPSSFLDSAIPYVKNQSVLDRFIYTFTGGSMTSIEKPAETEIGYVPGPNGRAVAYADGHVKWIPDQA